MSNVLEVKDLTVAYSSRAGFRSGKTVVVRGVSFDVAAGESLALVGESGSGKSTTAKAVLRLLGIEGGEIYIHGADWSRLRGRALRRARGAAQMVFQDPYSSLDPSMTVAQTIGQSIKLHRGLTRGARTQAVNALLERVGLSAAAASRYPAEFSGGQRQRIAIARALAAQPSLLVCDEAVSALDVSTQNQIVNLLGELRRGGDLGLLFIAHDLALVRHAADRVAVMYLGQIMETGPVEEVLDRPANPYTRALLSAMPTPDPDRDRTRRIRLSGDLPDPSDPPSGCLFSTRCPLATDMCRTVAPPERPTASGGTSRCHLSPEQVAGQMPIESMAPRG